MHKTIRIGRTLPPAAAPIGVKEIVSGIYGIFNGQRELDRFESDLKKHFGVKHCFLVSSGKAALTLILLALRDLSPSRNQVLIPAFTCYSVPSSIIRAGLKIRLCDLESEGLDFDFAQLSTILSEAFSSQQVVFPDCVNIKLPDKALDDDDNFKDSFKALLAIVPTHLFGAPADVPRLRRLVRDSRIAIVEDAAQAMGETWEGGRKLGTLGDVGFFSLGRGKAFSTVEGGVILTDRDDIAEMLKRRVTGFTSYNLLELFNLFIKTALLSLFIHPLLFWIPCLMPFLKIGETFFEPHFPIRRMSSFQAGLARNWQVRLQKLQDSRKKNVNRWISAINGLTTGRLHVNNHLVSGLIRFPIRVTNLKIRELLLIESARRGLGIMPAYPDTIDAIPELRGQIAVHNFPIAKSYTMELVTLPTHQYLKQKDVIKIFKLIRRNKEELI